MNGKESGIGSGNTRTQSGNEQIVQPSESDAAAAIERILRFTPIANRPRLVKLLRYIVREEIENRGDRLKGFAIAVDVFQRGDDFDPQTDSIVRVEMFRLRQALAEYYTTIGNADPLRIDVPKGSYRPVFVEQAIPDVAESVVQTPSRVLCLRFDLAACCAVALIGLGYFAGELDAKPEPASPHVLEQAYGPCVGRVTRATMNL